MARASSPKTTRAASRRLAGRAVVAARTAGSVVCASVGSSGPVLRCVRVSLRCYGFGHQADQHRAAVQIDRLGAGHRIGRTKLYLASRFGLDEGEVWRQQETHGIARLDPDGD